jgi:Flp pilus assembly protein TadD
MDATTKSQSADALYTVGHWLLTQERFEDAKHVFRTMLFVAPSDERGWLGLGACHEGMNEIDTAVKLYTLVPNACATHVRATVALGRALRKLERDALADEAFARAEELVNSVDEPELAMIVAMEMNGGSL